MRRLAFYLVFRLSGDRCRAKKNRSLKSDNEEFNREINI